MIVPDRFPCHATQMSKLGEYESAELWLQALPIIAGIGALIAKYRFDYELVSLVCIHTSS